MGDKSAGVYGTSTSLPLIRTITGRMGPLLGPQGRHNPAHQPSPVTGEASLLAMSTAGDPRFA